MRRFPNARHRWCMRLRSTRSQTSRRRLRFRSTCSLGRRQAARHLAGPRRPWRPPRSCRPVPRMGSSRVGRGGRRSGGECKGYPTRAAGSHSHRNESRSRKARIRSRVAGEARTRSLRASRLKAQCTWPRRPGRRPSKRPWHPRRLSRSRRVWSQRRPSRVPQGLSRAGRHLPALVPQQGSPRQWCVRRTTHRAPRRGHHSQQRDEAHVARSLETADLIGVGTRIGRPIPAAHDARRKKAPAACVRAGG